MKVKILAMVLVVVSIDISARVMVAFRRLISSGEGTWASVASYRFVEFLCFVGLAGCTQREMLAEAGTPLKLEVRKDSVTREESNSSALHSNADSNSPSNHRIATRSSEENPGKHHSRTKLSEAARRSPETRRIVAIGDLHGDLQATRAAFRLAGAIDENHKWIGGELVVVQTGDQLDRGDDEKLIFDFLTRIGEEAKRAGGELHVLNGNHEFMNSFGDFRYVTPAAMDSFSNTGESSSRDPSVLASPVHERGRRAAFLPGKGPIAKQMAERKVILVVGDSVFVHGGVLPKYVAYGVDRINLESRKWLLGEITEAPIWMTDQQGPIWTRAYSDQPNEQACKLLHEALLRLSSKRMVVGHTVQKNGVQSACGGEVWMIDVGMSRAYGGNLEVLEILGNQVTSIRPNGISVPSGQ